MYEHGVKNRCLVSNCRILLGRNSGSKVASTAEVLVLPRKLVVREVNLVVLHLKVD